MYKYRYRKEKFGFIVSYPNGEVKIIDKKATKLVVNKEIDSLAKYEIPLEKINIEKYLPFDAPLLTDIELTRRCNLRCKHCYLEAGKKRESEMNTNDIKNLLLQLKKMGVFFVFLIGGEPTLRDDFKEIINYLFEIDLDFNVVTNATLINKNFLTDLNPRTPFIISFDGIKTHSRIKCGFDKFGRIQDKLLLLKKLKFPFMAQYTLQKCNFEDLINTYKWCADNEIILTAMDVLYVGRTKSSKNILPTKNDLKRNKKLMMAKLNYEKIRTQFKHNSYNCQTEVANPYYFSFVADLMNTIKKSYPGIFSAYIASDGEVYPSTYSAVDPGNSEGSIFDKSYKNIWKNKFQKLRKLTWNNFDCKQCELIKKGSFCDLQMPYLSKNIYGKKLKCGATPFLKEAMLQRFLLRKKIQGTLSEDLARFIDNY